jgi:small subunit ribosomal protein S8e
MVDMAIWHRTSKRKLTGGMLKKHSKKARMDLGRDNIPVKIAKRKASRLRTRGGNQKMVLFSETFANIAVGSQIKRAKILSVVKNPANPNLVRQNIITKGCTVQTEIGKAVVTSSPGQCGVVNAVLVEEK